MDWFNIEKLDKMFNLDKFISVFVTKRPVSMFAPDIEANKETLSKEIKDKKVCVIATDEYADRYDAGIVKSIGSRNDEDIIAHRLYTILRECDDENIEVIYSESFDTSGIGQAIMNRLLKAAGHKVIGV